MHYIHGFTFEPPTQSDSPTNGKSFEYSLVGYLHEYDDTSSRKKCACVVELFAMQVGLLCKQNFTISNLLARALSKN